MSQDFAHVAALEHGVVRVFLADYQLYMEIGHFGTYDRFERALGDIKLDHDHIQQLQTRVLGDMSFAQFLTAGYDVREDDLRENSFALSAVEDEDVMLLIVRSPAFVDKPVTLKTDGEARLIATLREVGATVTFQPLLNPDPKAVVEDPPQKKRPSDAAMSGRVATLALLVMGLLVWLMIWIAG